MDYDLPDDEYLRKKTPVWAEHWNSMDNETSSLKSVANLIYKNEIKKKLTPLNWFKLTVILICLIFLLMNMTSLIKNYYNFKTFVSAKYELPTYFKFPSITLCISIVIPFDTNESPITVGQLFNLSQAEYGHQCVFTNGNLISDSLSFSSTSNQSPINLLPCNQLSSVEITIDKNRKCFTYFYHMTSKKLLSIKMARTSFVKFTLQTDKILTHEELSSSGSLGSQSSNDIYLGIHQSNMVPTKDNFEFITIKPNYNYELSFKLTQIELNSRKSKLNYDCKNYTFDSKDEDISSWPSSGQITSFDECYHQCVQDELEKICKNTSSYCISRFAPIRKSSIDNQNRLCSINSCNNHHYQLAKKSCDEQQKILCPKDCIIMSYDVSSREVYTGDPTSITILIQRKLTPDLIINHSPSITGVQIISSIGGLISFWLFIIWLIFLFIKFCLLIWEFIQIYYL